MNGGDDQTNGSARTRKPSRLIHIQPMRHRSNSPGFTLVEMMITVVVIGILVAVAYPTYIDQVRKGRRADAFDALVLVQQQQERYRSQNQQYAADLDALKLSNSSAAGHYKLTLAETSAIGYTVTAAPSAGGRQAGDKDCSTLKLVVFKGTQQRSATNEGGADTTYRCWPQ